MQGAFYAYTLAASKAILILLSFAILLRCLRSMLREEYDPETWAYLRYGRDRLPVQHWEVIIGRSPDADVYIPEREIARSHAILRRNDLGEWRVYDVFSRGGVDQAVLDDLRREMMEAADALEFERAAYLRDQIKSLEKKMV